ncbi:kelch-like protein 24 [Babylonia areolata]|uniref:kelch-like protein 24 n=1 Tax=Babylonia areolata TaxID=304850 RepID=UPI003FD2B910
MAEGADREVCCGSGEDGVEDDLSTSDTSFVSTDHTDQLIDNLERLRLDLGYTDLTITIDNHRFPCHKVVLAAGSPYFRIMFASGMEESRKDVIEIKQIEATVFEQVLRFIYTGRVDIGGGTVQELFMQAQLFQIAHLVELCVTFFQDCMNEGNCLAAMTLADLHAHRAMYEYAKNFACQHFSTVTEDDDFLRLSVECITDLLRDRHLNCTTEEQVYEAAVRWVEHDRKHREHQALQVLQCIKFPLINRSYFMDTIAPSTYLIGEEGRELMDSAVLYHTVPSRRHMLPSYQVTPRLSFPYFECAILLGGRLGEGLSSDVECYRSDTGEFTSLKPLPFKKRNEFAACAIGDEIYVSGGLRSGEFWKYDPTFESWLRGASMVQPRRRHAMAAVDDTIFVLGGFDEDQVLDSVEVWERKTNKWEECCQLATAVENMGYVAHGKKIYLFGGKNSEEVVTNLVQCFDTKTRTCTLCKSCLPANDMCVSATVLNSRIYVVGLEGFFSYQPGEDAWTVLPNMFLPRDFVSLCVLDEKLYAFGGRRRGAKDNLYSDSMEVFDPATGVWTSAGHLPVPMYSYGCVRVFLSGPLNNKRQSFHSSGGTDGTVRSETRALSS